MILSMVLPKEAWARPVTVHMDMIAVTDIAPDVSGGPDHIGMLTGLVDRYDLDRWVPMDVDALANRVQTARDLGANHPIAELDITPVLASPGDTLALDALVMLEDE